MNACCKFLRTKHLKLGTFIHSNVFQRHLYSPAVLGLLEFDNQRTTCIEKIGHKKGEFLKRLEKGEGSKIFTEDLKTLCYLASNKTEFTLMFKVLERYCELQEKKSFVTYFPAGFYTLCMLYRHGQHEMAFNWFLDEKYNVNNLCRNRECFLLMMDLLYENGRYQDVVGLLSSCDTVLDRRHPEIITLVLAALYKMNTQESFEQMQTILNELCTDPIQLTVRSAMLCAMLAYKQHDIDMMLEIPHLPVFKVCTGALISTIPNIQILAYVEMGQTDKAIDILKTSIIKFRKPVHLFFEEVLSKLDMVVKSGADVEQKSLYEQIRRTLKISGFMFPVSIDDYMLRTIGYKEYQRLLTMENPPRMFQDLRTLPKTPEKNPLIT